jgi:hypothetical protein
MKKHFFYKIGVYSIEVLSTGHTNMFGKHELTICSDFIFQIVKFPFVRINIAAYGVYIIDAMRYSRA